MEENINNFGVKMGVIDKSSGLLEHNREKNWKEDTMLCSRLKIGLN